VIGHRLPGVRKARLTFVVLAVALGFLAQALPASAQSYPPLPTPKVAVPTCLSATTGSTLPQAEVQSTAAAIRVTAGSHFQGIAPCSSGRIIVWLTPGSEGLAKQVQAKYGPAVTISVGLTTWKGHAGRSPRCGSLPSWTAPPRGLSLSLHLKADTVRSGDVATGNVEITNRGTAPFFMDTGQPLQAVIVRPGSHQIVGAYTGGIAGTGYGMRLTKGQHENVPTFVGTARCDGGLGSALPPGKYQAVVLVMDETGKGPRYLTPPTALTVTPSRKGA
jgi:hypothetical protein